MRPEPAPTIVKTKRGLVEYAEFGEGPVILALHGGMGGFDQGLILARATLTPGQFRVLSISRPGYLGTPLASGLSPAEQASLCAALLDELRIDAAAVVAVSAGGLCALQFAIRYPDRCWGAVLVSACTGPLDVPKTMAVRFWVVKHLLAWPGLPARFQRRMKDPEQAARRSIRDPAIRDRMLRDSEAGPLFAALQSGITERLGQRLAGTANDMKQGREAPAGSFSKVIPPVLVIHGTADRIVPFSHAKAVAEGAPHAELCAIEDGEHVSVFTHLAEIRKRTTGFLHRLQPPASKTGGSSPIRDSEDNRCR